MKHKNGKAYAGVCMDNASAVFITLNKEAEDSEFTIQQTIKGNESHGGGSEHSMNNAKHTDALKYFKQVATELMPFDEVHIFGAGMVQEQFKNYLAEDAQFNNKQVSISSTEQHITDPQKIAVVRDFFKVG
jgi:stalled ribosome rescue protein Dom34